MQISFHGAAGTVTGSNHLVETAGGKFLIDCGMFQGPRDVRQRNFEPFPYEPLAIDAVLCTHAHIDHSGLLPKLVRAGFRGPIYATHASAELLEVLLYDSSHIQNADLEYKNKQRVKKGLPPFEPLYTDEDVETTLSLVKEVPYHEPFNILSDVRCTLRDAGHIMGSAFAKLEITENGRTRILVASGDLGRSHQAIISDPEVGDHADMILMESTYGNRTHKTREDTNKELLTIMQQVVKEKGTMIVPAFAVGRTQELVFRIFELAEKHELPKIKIFIDSPMAAKVTKIYQENRDLYDEKTLEYIREGKNPLDFKQLHFTESAIESKALNDTAGPKLIISASGMCDAGRIVHHLRANVWKENVHILFVGYQAVGTLGRRLIEGAQRVRIMGEELQVKAKIHTIGGLSAHADSDDMISWLRFYKDCHPEVFLVHGDPEASEGLAARIAEELSLQTHIPDWHDTYAVRFEEEGIEVALSKGELVSPLPAAQERWQALVGQIGDYLKGFGERGEEAQESRAAGSMLEKMNRNLELMVEAMRADLGELSKK